MKARPLSSVSLLRTCAFQKKSRMQNVTRYLSGLTATFGANAWRGCLH